MSAVSQTYRSIYFSELAYILGVDQRRAEKIAAEMILDGSLHGSMDEVEGLLEFELDEPPLAQWDRSFLTFCTELNSLSDAISNIELPSKT